MYENRAYCLPIAFDLLLFLVTIGHLTVERCVASASSKFNMSSSSAEDCLRPPFLKKFHSSNFIKFLETAKLYYATGQANDKERLITFIDKRVLIHLKQCWETIYKLQSHIFSSRLVNQLRNYIEDTEQFTKPYLPPKDQTFVQINVYNQYTDKNNKKLSESTKERIGNNRQLLELLSRDTLLSNIRKSQQIGYYFNQPVAPTRKCYDCTNFDDYGSPCDHGMCYSCFGHELLTCPLCASEPFLGLPPPPLGPNPVRVPVRVALPPMPVPLGPLPDSSSAPVRSALRSATSGAERELPDCPICQDLFRNVPMTVELPCHHRMCKSCHTLLVAHIRNCVCPICRHPNAEHILSTKSYSTIKFSETIDMVSIENSSKKPLWMELPGCMVEPWMHELSCMDKDASIKVDLATLETYARMLYSPIPKWEQGPGATMPRHHPDVKRHHTTVLGMMFDFYCYHFRPIVLAEDAPPPAICGGFSKEPLKCYTQYCNDFTKALRYLHIEHRTTRKKLFLKGIPECNTSLRGMVKRMIGDDTISFDEMVNEGANRLIPPEAEDIELDLRCQLRSKEVNQQLGLLQAAGARRLIPQLEKFDPQISQQKIEELLPIAKMNHYKLILGQVDSSKRAKKELWHIKKKLKRQQELDEESDKRSDESDDADEFNESDNADESD